MSKNHYESPSVVLTEMKALRGGLGNLPAGTTQVVAGGQVSTVTQVEAELDGYVATYQAESDAEAALKKAAQARATTALTAVPRFEAISAAVKTMFGKKSPDLAKVGLEPDKTPAPLTVDQKQTKVTKTLATRKARGTMGPKAKAKIHGAVPAPPAPPAPSPSPAVTPAVKPGT